MNSSNNANLSQLVHQLCDIVGVFSASFIAYSIRFQHLEIPATYWTLTFIGCIFSIAFSTHKEVYLSHSGPTIKKYSDILTIWIMTGILLLLYLVFTKQANVYARLWLIIWGLLTLSISLTLHTFAFLIEKRILKRVERHICLVGNSQTIPKITGNLNGKQTHNFVIDSSINYDETKNVIDKILECESSQEIWISLPLGEGKLIKDISLQLKNETRDIRFIPEISDLLLLNHRVEQIADLSVINLSCSPMQGSNSLIKRVEDICLSLFFLLLFTPIMLIISIIIKSTSPGPVIYKQKRHGLNGKEITVFKFRSMVVHQEKGLVKQATKDDDRITPFGAFIRRTSLDELPQFLNVLFGSMSIVGPRPHALSHNEYYKELIESYMRRHKVKPGITGWAQANGFRGETDTIDKMEKRVEHDLYYIDNWSLFFDLKIIILTAYRMILKQKNAY